MGESEAHIHVDDLDQVLDYLEGLELILSSLKEQDGAIDVRPDLFGKLGASNSDQHAWNVLQDEDSPDQGLQQVVSDVRALRHRLLRIEVTPDSG